MKSSRTKFYKYKNIIYFFCRIINILPKSFLARLLIFFRAKTGLLGVGIRYVLVKNLAKSCGDNLAVMENVYFDAIHLMEFGNNVSINPLCYLAGEITIGNDVAIAHTTSFHSANHTWNNKEISISQNPINTDRIIIENDVWISCNCVILSGLVIGGRSVIGAGSIVTKSISKNSLVAGNPARFIKRI
jgi:acetyltransferase-like isoleucine patch superfamily enzyme